VTFEEQSQRIDLKLGQAAVDFDRLAEFGRKMAGVMKGFVDALRGLNQPYIDQLLAKERGRQRYERRYRTRGRKQ
jgi:hypothetical protein